MVGVPGRSKACVTCLKRRKRCDLEKPTCGPCRKLHIECGGYYRPRVFINNTVQIQSRKERGNSGDSDNPSSTESESVALIPTLARSAYQTKYLDLFWRLYLPNGKALPNEVTRIALGGWIDAIQDFHSNESVLKNALLAMSLTAVGAHENNTRLREDGLRLYASSMQGMAVAMRNPRRATSDGILTAIRLFSLYESMFGKSDAAGLSQARSWAVHNTGDVALLKSRSPYSYVSGYAHELFADGRLNLTLSFLRERKTIFLAEPEWKTIPWIQHRKSPRDHLVDVLIDMAPLFEEMDLMKSYDDVHAKESTRQHLLYQFIQLSQDLHSWRALHALEFEPPSKLSEAVRPDELAAAHLMTLFWTTSIVVGSNIQGLCRPGEEIDLGMDLDLFCGHIVRTIPFFCHPSMGLFRTHITTYPVTVALHYICAAGPRRLAEERRILADCLYDPACAGVRKFIASMKEQYPLEFLK